MRTSLIVVFLVAIYFHRLYQEETAREHGTDGVRFSRFESGMLYYFVVRSNWPYQPYAAKGLRRRKVAGSKNVIKASRDFEGVSRICSLGGKSTQIRGEKILALL